MTTWRRYLRYALAVFIVGLGAAVLFGLRDRADPVRAVAVERADPDAVIQTRGSRIVQADAAGENLSVVAAQQLTYSDGTIRLLDGVEVTVAEREGRPGFVLTGDEASVDENQTAVELSGTVTFSSGDGLEAATENASYLDAEGIVRMPGEATFTREGMLAKGRGAKYERSRDLLRLLDAARVDLTADGARTRITSRSATLAQTEGYMEFEGGVDIDAGTRQMEAARARVSLLDDTSDLEALELLGGSRIRGDNRVAGELREMSATTITLAYGESGQQIKQAALMGRAVVKLYGVDLARGARISGQSMDVELTPDDGSVRLVVTRRDVVLDLPSTPTQPTQRIRAEILRLTGETGDGLEDAQFAGAVEYRETRRSNGADLTRIAHADRLEATLTDGMSTLEGARFHGSVTFEDQEVTGEADEALYRVTEGIMELLTVEAGGQTPRVVDRRGSVQAQTIRLTLDGPKIDATGSVESVLTTAEREGDDANDEPSSRDDVKRPRLLDAAEPVLVTADRLFYDDTTAVATYTGRAHLWQDETEFNGEEIVLDEATGNISASGGVRTRTILSQLNDDTRGQEDAVTTGRARQMQYDDTLRMATYTTDAHVTGPRGDLFGDTIRIYLHEDSKTLDRVEASGNVRLETPGRFVSGETLFYYDADGRYEMEGEPVRIVEDLEEECRETIGRTLTFFITGDELSVDGRAETRTQTASGECLELKRK